MGPHVSKEELQRLSEDFSVSSSKMQYWLNTFKQHWKSLKRKQMTLEEFKAAFQDIGMDDKRLELLFQLCNRGSVTFQQFVLAAVLSSNVPVEIKLRAAFGIIDKDDSKSIELGELQRLAQLAESTRSLLTTDEQRTTKQRKDETKIDDQAIRRTFRLMDADDNKHISLEEFMRGVKKDGKWIMELFQIESS